MGINVSQPVHTHAHTPIEIQVFSIWNLRPKTITKIHGILHMLVGKRFFALLWSNYEHALVNSLEGMKNGFIKSIRVKKIRGKIRAEKKSWIFSRKLRKSRVFRRNELTEEVEWRCWRFTVSLFLSEEMKKGWMTGRKEWFGLRCIALNWIWT